MKMKIQSCRLCGHALSHTFIDLGLSPLANSYVNSERLYKMEPMYPLRTFVCDHCFLIQVEDFESPQHIFSDYAYFSSYSDSWLAHCKQYADRITARQGLDADKQVIEIASNDGYLLQFFKEKGIPVLGIEPAENVAEQAREKGIPTVVEFFGTVSAEAVRSEGMEADLLIGNNVLAHVPDLNDFVAGMKLLLAEAGIITMEFPHLLRLMQENQFDTIYHEHYSYFSFTTVNQLFARHGLIVFDVERLETHGGSLRIYAAHKNEDNYANITDAVEELLKYEAACGVTNLKRYADFKERVVKVKRQLLQFLLTLKEEGKHIVGYGAPAKGNTLLNYCGIDSDYLDYTVDRSPHKQGMHLPGSRIPIYGPEHLRATQPDYVLILPWNLKQEIIEQTEYIREWGGRWIIPIPEVMVVE